MSKPIIGYTTRNFVFDPLQWLIYLSIIIGGGRPLRLYPKSPKLKKHIDGLIIGGGTDLHPELFNSDPKLGYKYDQARDDLEIEWLKKADERNIPVMGICRGSQLLNIIRGGSLHLDISKVYKNAVYPSSSIARIFFRKFIDLKSETLLFDLLKKKRLKVNSLHTQAVKDLGNGLVVSGVEDNGIVQAIEDPSKKFFLGVQFHPEALIYQARFRRFFKRFVEASRS